MKYTRGSEMIHAARRVLVASVAVSAVALIGDVKATDVDGCSGSWQEDNSRVNYGDSDCTVRFGINFLGDPDPPLSITKLQVTTAAAAAGIEASDVIDGKNWVWLKYDSASPTYTIDIEYDTDPTGGDFGPSDTDVLAKTQLTTLGSSIEAARVIFNCSGGFDWGTHQYDDSDKIAAHLHEVGHALGACHTSGGVMQSPLSTTHPLSLSEEEQTLFHDHYGLVSKAAGCYFGPVTVHGGRALFDGLQTEIVIGANLPSYSDSGTIWVVEAGGQEQTVGTAALAAEDGSSGDVLLYKFYDSGGYAGKEYLVFEDAAPSEPAMKLVAGEVGVPLQGASITEMRSYNESRIRKDKWRDIALGANVQGLDEVIQGTTEYLVFCFEEFIDEIAPLCDYWDTHGVTVELVSVGYGDQSYVRDMIRYRLMQVKNEVGSMLSAVCLVGYAQAGGYANGYLDHVPTFYDPRTDLPYVLDNNNGEMFAAIGRVPAQTENDVITYVHRSLRYNTENISSYGKKPSDFAGSLAAISPIPEDSPACGPSPCSSQQYLIDTWSRVAGLLAPYADMSQFATHSYYPLGDPDIAALWTEQTMGEYRDANQAAVMQALSNAYVANVFPRHNGIRSIGSCYDIEEMSMPRSSEVLFLGVFQCYGGAYCAFERTIADASLDLLRPNCEEELFNRNALVVFGPSVPALNVANARVGERFSEMVWSSAPEVSSLPIGEIWRTLYNELIGDDAGLAQAYMRYALLGDPMQFIRGVTGQNSPSAVRDVPSIEGIRLSPNPFNPKIVARFAVDMPTQVQIAVYDIRGRRVRVLLEGMVGEGYNQVIWDGRDAAGKDLAAAPYFIRFDTGHEIVTHKIMLIR